MSLFVDVLFLCFVNMLSKVAKNGITQQESKNQNLERDFIILDEFIPGEDNNEW